jgi:hypothetical protein
MRTPITAVVLFLFWLAPIVAPGLPGSDARAEDAWETFTSEEAHFTVAMPKQPVKTETQQESFIGTVTNHIFTAETGQNRYTVDASDIPHFALHFAGAETIYDHAKGALLKKTFSKPTSYTDVTVSGAPAKRLVYDTPPAPGNPPMRGDAILVLIGTRLYVIDAVLLETEADTSSERFLSSFKPTK